MVLLEACVLIFGQRHTSPHVPFYLVESVECLTKPHATIAFNASACGRVCQNNAEENSAMPSSTSQLQGWTPRICFSKVLSCRKVVWVWLAWVDLFVLNLLCLAATKAAKKICISLNLASGAECLQMHEHVCTKLGKVLSQKGFKEPNGYTKSMFENTWLPLKGLWSYVWSVYLLVSWSLASTNFQTKSAKAMVATHVALSGYMDSSVGLNANASEFTPFRVGLASQLIWRDQNQRF